MPAADAAQADGFVNAFTDGYNMELGQGGVNVSVTKAEIVYRKSTLKNRKILILDDSTSAADMLQRLKSTAFKQRV